MRMLRIHSIADIKPEREVSPMRRLLTILLVLLAAVSLVLSGCKKRTVKDTAEDEDPTPGPGDPPLPGLR